MAIWGSNSKETEFINDWGIRAGDSKTEGAVGEKRIRNRGPNKQIQKAKLWMLILDNAFEGGERKTEKLVSIFGYQSPKRVGNL